MKTNRGIQLITQDRQRLVKLKYSGDTLCAVHVKCPKAFPSPLTTGPYGLNGIDKDCTA